MANASVWFSGNDMRVRLDKLQSSTMGSTGYLNSSTGVTCVIWKSVTTGSTSNIAVASQNMPYMTGSNGRYDVTIESTEHGMSNGTKGFAQIVLSHSGLDGEWRANFWVKTRGTT